MTDRELLEAAARAADIDARRIGNGYRLIDRVWVGGWNPLTNDGDALRLAVALNIGIHPDKQVAEISTSFMVGDVGHNMTEEWWSLRAKSKADPCAATRRAIVRAAAAMAENVSAAAKEKK